MADALDRDPNKHSAEVTAGDLPETAASVSTPGLPQPNAIHGPGIEDPEEEEEEHDVDDLRRKLLERYKKGKRPATDELTTPSGIFGANEHAMREKIRMRYIKPQYDVKDFYKDRGFPQKIARAHWFEYVTLAIIGLNAIWISIDADYNHAGSLQESDLGFQLAEHFFCSFFFSEWLVRYLSFRATKYALQDKWFLFDSALVVLMVLETWAVSIAIAITRGSSSSTDFSNVTVLRLLRLLRLTRVTRLARLLRAVPELLFMIKGMLAATRSVLLTMLLLFFIIYVFAIMCRQLSNETPVGKTYFPTIPDAIYTLWIHGTLLDDLASVSEEIKNQDMLLWITFFFLVLLAALTLMNMLIGVLCEVVSNVAKAEREEMNISFVRQKTMQVFREIGADADNDGKISKNEFADLVVNDQAIDALADVGVDIETLVDYAEIIFQSDFEGAKFDKNLEFDEFMDLVLQLRSSNDATVKDISDLRKFIHNQNTARNRALLRIDDGILDLDARMHLLQSKQTRMEKKLEMLCQTCCPDKLCKPSECREADLLT